MTRLSLSGLFMAFTFVAATSPARAQTKQYCTLPDGTCGTQTLCDGYQQITACGSNGCSFSEWCVYSDSYGTLYCSGGCSWASWFVIESEQECCNPASPSSWGPCRPDPEACDREDECENAEECCEEKRGPNSINTATGEVTYNTPRPDAEVPMTGGSLRLERHYSSRRAFKDAHSERWSTPTGKVWSWGAGWYHDYEHVTVATWTGTAYSILHLQPQGTRDRVLDTSQTVHFQYHPARFVLWDAPNDTHNIFGYDGATLHFEEFLEAPKRGRLRTVVRDGSPTITLTWYQNSNPQAACYVSSQSDPRWARPCFLEAGTEAFIHFAEYDRQQISEGEPFDEESRHALLMALRYGHGNQASQYTAETRYAYDIATVLDANGNPYVDPATNQIRKRRLLSSVSYYRTCGDSCTACTQDSQCSGGGVCRFNTCWPRFDRESYTYTNQSYVRPDLGADPATNPYTVASTITSMHDGFNVLSVDLLSHIRHRDGSLREGYAYDKYGRGAASVAPGEALLVRRVPLSATSERVLVTDESSGATTEYQADDVAAAGEPRQMRLSGISSDCGCSTATASYERDASGFVTARRDLPATPAGTGTRTAFGLDNQKRVMWQVDNWEGALPVEPSTIDPNAGPSRVRRFDHVWYVPTTPTVESRVHSVICDDAATWDLTCAPGTYALSPALVRDFDLVEAGNYNDAAPPPAMETSTLPQREVSIGYQLTDLSSLAVTEQRRVRRYTYATPAGPLASVEEGGIVTSYEYYSASDPVALNRNKLWKVFRGATLLQTFSSYDAHGNAQLIVDNQTGVEQARTFDAAGRLVSATLSAAGASRATSYTYNDRGLIEKVVSASTPAANEAITVSGYVLPAGLTPPDAASFCAMDSAPAVQNCLDALGYLDRPSQVDTGGGSGGVLTQLDRREVYAYDRQGRATSVTVTNGASTERYLQRQFDSMDRLIRQLKFTSSTAAPAAVQDVYYDLLGRMSKVADENHALLSNSHTQNETRANKQYGYDPLGRLQTVTEGAGPAARVTTYGYDSDDNLTNVVDADGRLTSYLYDDFGQLTVVDSPDSGRTLYRYDALGNLVAKLEPGTPVVLTEYVYDGLGRLAQQLTSVNGIPESAVVYGFASLSGSNAPAAPVSETCADGPRTFDPQALGGRLAWVRHASGSTYYSYDALGEVNAVFEQPGTSASICYWSIVRYGYDGLGRLTSITYPSGRGVSYTYASGATRPTRLSAALEILGQPAELQFLSLIGYDVDGAVNRFWADSVEFSATRDYAGQPLRRLYDRNGTALFDWRIDERDQVGNIERVSDASSARLLALGYDDAYRVTSAAGSTLRGYQDCGYAYDKAGNRTGETCYGHSISYVYAPAGQPADNKLRELEWMTGATCGPPELAERQLLPDARGRQTVGYTRKYPQTADAFGIDYDAQGRIDQVTVGGDTYLYSYDHRNLRVRKDGPAGPTLYTYDTAGRLLAERMSAETREYVWLNGEPVAVLVSDNVSDDMYLDKYTLGVDHLGTPMRAWDFITGDPAWAADYEAFGRATTYVPNSSAAPQVEVNLRFPGQIYDAETGLHYNWHRYYSPDTGRYLQLEPLAAVVPGWDQPTYAYGLNSPAVNFDDNGLLVQSAPPVIGTAFTVYVILKICEGMGWCGPPLPPAPPGLDPGPSPGPGSSRGPSSPKDPGSPSGPSGPGEDCDDDDPCMEQYWSDYGKCVSLRPSELIRPCLASATDRLGDCYAGRPPRPLANYH